MITRARGRLPPCMTQPSLSLENPARFCIIPQWLVIHQFPHTPTSPSAVHVQPTLNKPTSSGNGHALHSPWRRGSQGGDASCRAFRLLRRSRHRRSGSISPRRYCPPPRPKQRLRVSRCLRKRVSNGLRRPPFSAASSTGGRRCAFVSRPSNRTLRRRRSRLSLHSARALP